MPPRDYSDLLDTSKLLHRSLLAALAVSLVVIVSPSERQLYEGALSSARLLQAIDFEEYDAFQARAISKASSNKEVLREALMTQVGEGSVRSAPGLIAGLDIPSIRVPTPATRQLAELDRWFNRNQDSVAIGLALGTTGEKLRAALYEQVQRLSPGGCIGDASFLLDDAQMDSLASADRLGRAGIEGTLVFWVDQDCRGNGAEGQLQIPVVPLRVEQTSPVDFILAQGGNGTDGLIGDIEGHWTLAPDLKPVWNEVLNKDLEEAVAELEGRYRAAQAKVSLLGFDISGALIVVAVPAAFCILLAYLVFNLCRLLDLAGAEDGSSETYPKLRSTSFLGLMAGGSARTAFAVTVSLLPTVAIVLLLSLDLDAQPAAVYAAACLAVVVFVLGVRATYIAGLIQARLHVLDAAQPAAP